MTIPDNSPKTESNFNLKELQKLRLVFEQTTGAIIILDKDFRFEYINPYFERLSGYTKQELLGHAVPDFFSNKSLPDSNYELVRTLIKGEKWEGELQTFTKTGTTYWANAVATPYKDENGHPEGYIIVQQDITEKRKIQQLLEQSESKYKTLVENSLNGILIVRDNLILFANKTLCKMLGYSHEYLHHLISQTIVHPDDQHIVFEIGQRRRNQDFSTINETLRLIANDGSIKICESNSTVIEFEGQWASFFTIQDVTERINAQHALAKSEQKYRELAEMLPQTVFEINQQGYLRYLNKTGISKFGANFQNMCVFDLVIPEDLGRMRENFTNVSVNRVPAKGNIYTLKEIDGSLFPAMISASPMVVEGNPNGSRGVVIDLSDQFDMQKALKESEEKYRTLIENATDGIVIVQNGLLMFANQTMCDIMKYSIEELTSKPFLNFIDASEHETLLAFHNRRMQGEQFSKILRSRFIRKDKKKITVELNARTSNYNGSPAGFIVIRDITDRLKIENELQMAKNELEKLNSQLEKRVKESSRRLIETRTQLLNLQKENLQSQYDVLKQQVNPHFLFNSLNVLTSLIKLEPDLAEQFSEQLSKVYRYVLENKDNELVDLQTELTFLDAYIFLINIRFIGKLKVNIDIPENRRNDRIIPLAMQLLIENAIKHNIMSKQKPLEINIFIDKNNQLNIINNLQERPSQIISTGVGLKNIQKRYQLLNNSTPLFEKTAEHFVAKIPLIID